MVVHPFGSRNGGKIGGKEVIDLLLRHPYAQRSRTRILRSVGFHRTVKDEIFSCCENSPRGLHAVRQVGKNGNGERTRQFQEWLKLLEAVASIIEDHCQFCLRFDERGLRYRLAVYARDFATLGLARFCS
jgi:hypothetical protein